MKALFIGLGSIGQRHLRNLKFVLNSDVEIYALRSKNSKNLIIDSGKAIKVASLEEYYGIKFFYNIEEALAVNPDIVFITNPSSLHIKMAIRAAKNKCHLFIEKPLSNSMKNVNLLRELVVNQNIYATVAYQSRFNPSHNIIKKIINSNELGKIITAEFKWGTYLPHHHPYENYKKSYASRKDLGGGVVLGLSHEIDMVRDLFGIPNKILAREIKDNSLNLEVEDNVEITFSYCKKNFDFDLNMSLSYSQINEERFFKIEFSKAFLINDLISNSVVIKNKDDGASKTLKFGHIKRDDLFILELEDFLKNLSYQKKDIRSFDGGINTLKICLEILKILEENK